MLLNQLFRKGYDRRKGEPVKLMSQSPIPMLLIQSRHDGLIEYACAEDFQKKARKVGNACELYTLNDLKSTHTRYTAGMFLETREENRGLDRFFSWIEEREVTCNQSISAKTLRIMDEAAENFKTGNVSSEIDLSDFR